MTQPAGTQGGDPFDALFDSLFDPAAVVDPKTGRFVRANAAAEVLLGYSGQALTHLGPADIHPHELPRMQRFLAEVRGRGRWSTEELACRRSDGERVPAAIRATLIRPGTDQERLLLVIRDRREHRLAELGASVRQLFHDLKNTLATAQILCDRLAGDDRRSVRLSAEAMARALERAVQLCRDTVQVGRARDRAPQRERFLLADVLEEVEATALLPEETGRLTDDSPEPVILDADFEQVYRILLNLVRNALDAGATRLTVTGRREAEAAVLDVADDGPGLPEAVRAGLGAEQRRASTAGSGLGLMIAAELAAAHGGALSIEATGPGGTRFRVRLPDA